MCVAEPGSQMFSKQFHQHERSALFIQIQFKGETYYQFVSISVILGFHSRVTDAHIQYINIPSIWRKKYSQNVAQSWLSLLMFTHEPWCQVCVGSCRSMKLEAKNSEGRRGCSRENNKTWLHIRFLSLSRWT
ncbi:unnamed protein product [Eretmochelys imbricata]